MCDPACGRCRAARYVGERRKRLRKLGYTAVERGNTVYLWPQNRRSYNPFVLRLISVQPAGGKAPIFLITNVLDHDKLSDETAAAILRVVRRAMQRPPAYRTLVQHLAGAIKDTCTRPRSKKARNCAHKKNDPPPGEPELRIVNEKEV